MKIGDFQLHPSLSMALGVDDNVFYAAEDEDPIVSGLLRIVGALKAKNRDANQTELKMDGQVGLQYLVFAEDGVSDDVLNARNGLHDASLSASGDFFRTGRVGLALHERLVYSDQAANDSTTAGYEQLSNTAGVDVRFRSRSGGVPPLSLQLGYRLALQHFLKSSASTRGNYVSHVLKLGGQWRFFPKTSLLLDVTGKYIDYDQAKQSYAMWQTTKSSDRDSMPLRAELGLQGLVTNRVSMSLWGGYLNTFQTAGKSYEGFVGRAQLHYLLEPVLSVKLAYSYDAGNSSFSNYYRKHVASLTVEGMFSEHWGARLKSEFDYYMYSLSGSPEETVVAVAESLPVKKLNNRIDPMVHEELSVDYHARDWLKASFAWRMDWNFTDYESPCFTLDPELRDKASYRRSTYMLSFSGMY